MITQHQPTDHRMNLIKNCINLANIEAGGMVGGIVSTSQRCIIDNCINVGTITTNFGASWTGGGGIISEVIGDVGITILNCVNIGTIKNAITLPSIHFNAFGGIVGRASNLTIDNCINYGYVKSSYTGELGGVGGIVGVISGGYWESYASITNSINVGVIESNERKGCLIGYNRYIEGTIRKNPIIINNNYWDKQMCPHDEIGEDTNK